MLLEVSAVPGFALLQYRFVDLTGGMAVFLFSSKGSFNVCRLYGDWPETILA